MNYEGDHLIVPQCSTWLFDIRDFIKEGLLTEPGVRAILWDDIVAHFLIKDGEIQVEW